MLIFRVPITSGVLDINYDTMLEGRTVSDVEALVILKDGAEVRETWTELSQDEYLAFCGAARLVADKAMITADGVDTATITASVPQGINEVAFVNSLTGEVIEIKPVINGKATLAISTSTPSIISVRVGASTILDLNRLEISAR